MESGKKLLPQQITTLGKKTKETQQQCDELEKYSRRVCLRADSAPKQNNEKDEDVLKFVKGQIEEVPDFEIPEAVIDREHRTVLDYTNKITQKLCKSIIVLFTTFRHRTLFCRAPRSIGSKSKARLDLTKP